MSEASAASIKSKEEKKREKKEAKEAKKEAKKAKRDKKKETEVGEEPAEEQNKDSAKAQTKDPAEAKAKSQWSEFAIWIGNLSYSTTKEDIADFFQSCNGTITRINMPRKGGKSRGFAFVDFDAAAPMKAALACSEQRLFGRAVLIKSASDYNKTGTPSRAGASTPASGKAAKLKGSKNPPSPTLFVGNLGFAVKRADLKAIFRPFGELVGVRVATFEDNQEKCKGFAYIDFKYTDDAAKAMQSPDVRTIGGRKARIEFAGEEATRKGRPWEYDPKTNGTYDSQQGGKRFSSFGGGEGAPREPKKARKLETENMAETKLQGLPVAFEGQKITFGD
ncbi:Nucleolar protein 13 [Coemansia sp. RSA 2706]|nr:Nucleolar protein 13 [Coemansia sp. RSA 2706]KAJ2309555.1 Nucleolar protein 13 [Coemansia sp. RSA 2705]KAJ2319338.1 Nucleolar protein 13 [Coemansia sp. RSA 2704]KAJ2325225.1 Nucleolar protein 13 [Coemansia sp. RSA 2702]KAJ2369587.1 Nucleolar protein 13 [Coemansia sp. RSA 2610]KAJ2381366.1 Nucleolar protein 13 [Coemansia sp. RSA 2611]KAJ2730592.1 Nucleolar protein 13 [Coemansia sp. Cherry 401B]